MKNIIIFLVSIIYFTLSCRQSHQRDFFDKVPDLYRDTSLSLYQLDSFGIQNKGVIINEKIYYKINNSMEGFIRLDGFVRFTDTCLYYLHKKNQKNEQPLFWFNQSKTKWRVIYNVDKLVELDSVRLISIFFDKNLNDTIYTYHLRSLVTSQKTNQVVDLHNELVIGISKGKGFVHLTNIRGFDTIKFLLYPSIKVTKSSHVEKRLFL